MELQAIPKDEFNEEIDFLGANINFGSLSGGCKNLIKIFRIEFLELMADAAINPLLTEEEFEKKESTTLLKV